MERETKGKKQGIKRERKGKVGNEKGKEKSRE